MFTGLPVAQCSYWLTAAPHSLVMSDTAGEVVLPQRLAIKRVAKTTATPDDPVNYPTIELLHESESGIACSNYDFVFKVLLLMSVKKSDSSIF